MHNDQFCIDCSIKRLAYTLYCLSFINLMPWSHAPISLLRIRPRSVQFIAGIPVQLLMNRVIGIASQIRNYLLLLRHCTIKQVVALWGLEPHTFKMYEVSSIRLVYLAMPKIQRNGTRIAMIAHPIITHTTYVIIFIYNGNMFSQACQDANSSSLESHGWMYKIHRNYTNLWEC